MEMKAQQEKNLKIINAFYFYRDRFALAYKDGKYGFIDKNGKILIGYLMNTPYHSRKMVMPL
jgi:hypothetical protein